MTRDAPGTSSDANLGCAEPERRHAEPNVQRGHYIVHGQCGERPYTSVTVTATASHSSASVAYDPGSTVPLSVGANPITVTVTAGDGTTKAVYRHGDARGAGSWVERRDAEWPEPEPVCTLNAQRIDAATTYAYTANVGKYRCLHHGYGSRRRRVMPLRSRVAQSPTNPVALSTWAPTTITVTVTAGDGTTTKAYTVTVTRAAAPTVPGLLVSIDDVTVHENTERDYTVPADYPAERSPPCNGGHYGGSTSR